MLNVIASSGGRTRFRTAVVRAAVAASVATAALLVPLLPAVEPGTAQSVQLVASADLGDCLRSEDPTVHGYATGAECPPAGFPYEPEVEITKAGLRAMDPYGNGCSKSRDTGATFNFKNACATHDYLADLQRYGAEGVSEASMDNQFLLDMKADCEGRNIVSRKSCEATAYTYRAFVQEGNYATGDPITSG